MRKRQLKKNMKALAKWMEADAKHFVDDLARIMERGRLLGWPKTIDFYMGNVPITVSIDEKKTTQEEPD